MGHKVTLIPGDGIGPEVTNAVVRILEATGVKFEWETFAVGSEAYSVEPYGAMMPKDDPEFAKVINTATANLYKSGQINPIYEKWFLKPIPPKGITMNVPMSPQLKAAFSNPTNSGDPAAYK